jgi:hypothetical protein
LKKRGWERGYATLKVPLEPMWKSAEFISFSGVTKPPVT